MLLTFNPGIRKYMFWKYVFHRPVLLNIKRINMYVDILHHFRIINSSVVDLADEVPKFSELRDRKYDLGRIRWFKNNQSDIDYIEVDGTHEPCIIDGRHRFAGAYLAQAKSIPVIYTGTKDLLEYLEV